jgi:hypothetical protein
MIDFASGLSSRHLATAPQSAIFSLFRHMYLPVSGGVGQFELSLM